MDENYITKHLLKIAILLYGKNSNCFAKKKKDYYIFGTPEIKNKISKQVALLIITGK